jgi:hypothetical protein
MLPGKKKKKIWVAKKGMYEQHSYDCIEANGRSSSEDL